MICPILIPLTMLRNDQTVYVNVGLIEEIMKYPEDHPTDDDEVKGGTLVFIHGRPAIRVSETMEDVRRIAMAATKNFVIETVQSLHARGLIK